MPRRRPLYTLSPLLAAVLVAGLTTPAAAAEPAPTNKVHRRWKFNLDTDALGWTRTRAFPFEGPNPDRDDHVGFGFARPLAGDRKIPMLGGSMFGLGLGYGISPYLILGARLGLTFDHLSSPNDGAIKNTTNFFSTVFTPYLEILPAPNGRILPFILVRTGFHAAAQGQRAHGPGVDNLDRISLMAPTVGIGGGAHFLLTDYFSLDASLMFDYRWVFAKGRHEDPSGVSLVSDWERSSQSHTLGVVLGFSVWFGGR